MATIIKRVRVANPRRRTRKATGGKRRVKLARTKTGQFISRARTRARMKTKRKTNRSVTRITRTRIVRKTNSRKRRVSRTPILRRKRRTRARSRKQNPVLMELGMLNPKRRTHVARKASRRKSRRNPRRRRHANAVRRVRRVRRVSAVRRRRRRVSNPVAVVRYRRRRRASNRVTHRRRRRMSNGRRRSNPSLFGRSGGKDLLMMTGGILVGVAATKYLPTIIPSSLTSSLGTSPIMGVVITGAGAFAAGWIAKKVGMSEDFASAVLLGGLAQAASKLLNVIAPPQLSQALALSGMGDIMPGNFVVPQNPMRLPMIAAAPAGAGGGMGAFRRAFGGNR